MVGSQWYEQSRVGLYKVEYVKVPNGTMLEQG